MFCVCALALSVVTTSCGPDGSDGRSDNPTGDASAGTEEQSSAPGDGTEPASPVNYAETLKDRLCATMPSDLVDAILPGATLESNDTTSASWYGESVECSFVADGEMIDLTIVAAPDPTWSDHASSIADTTIAGFFVFEGDDELIISANGVPIILSRSVISENSTPDFRETYRTDISWELGTPVLQFAGERWQEQYADYCSAVRQGSLDLHLADFEHATSLCDVHDREPASTDVAASEGELCAATQEAIAAAHLAPDPELAGLVVVARRSDGSVLAMQPGEEFRYWRIGAGGLEALSSEQYFELRTDPTSTQTEIQALVAPSGQSGFTCTEEYAEIGD